MKRPRSMAAGALAALTITGSLALARVFTNGSFALPVITAALLAHATGMLGRWRRWRLPLTVAVTAAVLLLAAAWLFAASTTTYGVPGPATLERLVSLVAEGWQRFRHAAAPVAPSDGLVLLCVLTAAVAATLADVLAFRLDATVGALVPSLLLFVLAATLGTDELRTVTTITYVIAALVFLMLANQAQLERRRTRCAGRRLGSSATVVNVGALVGGGALFVGLLVAPALPGAGSEPLLDYRTLGGPGPGGGGDYRTLSPLVDLRARLTELPDAELFTVDAPLRLYWRVAALDRFDGTVWGIESNARDAGDVLQTSGGAGVRQEFAIGALGDQWLPAAFEPRAVDLEGVRIIPQSATLVAPQEITGLRYQVRSLVPATPTPAEIAATAVGGPVPPIVRGSLALPGDFPDSARRLARRVTAAVSTPYERARRLEQLFLDGSFTYDLSVPPGSGNDAIVEFLEGRRGFCEQFAGTYAALARAVGIPARVAVGFTPGTYDADLGAFRVKARDAHAWPEVWLAGLGWTAFEPTPPGPEPGQADPSVGSPAQGDRPPATTPTAPEQSTPTSAPAVAAAPSGPARVEAGLTTTGGTGPDRRVLLVAAVAGVAIIGAASWAGGRVVRTARRRARRRESAPAHSVAGAWQDALEQLTAAGLAPSRALTPTEQTAAYRDRGATALDALDALDALAELYAMASWSPREPSARAIADAWQAADAVRATLASGASARERARRALRTGEPVRA